MWAGFSLLESHRLINPSAQPPGGTNTVGLSIHGNALYSENNLSSQGIYIQYPMSEVFVLLGHCSHGHGSRRKHWSMGSAKDMKTSCPSIKIMPAEPISHSLYRPTSNRYLSIPTIHHKSLNEVPSPCLFQVKLCHHAQLLQRSISLISKATST